MCGPSPTDIASLRPKLRLPTEYKPIKGWRIASESQAAKIVGNGPKIIVWLDNGHTYNTGLKRTNPAPGARVTGGRVLCVAKP